MKKLSILAIITLIFSNCSTNSICRLSEKHSKENRIKYLYNDNNNICIYYYNVNRNQTDTVKYKKTESRIIQSLNDNMLFEYLLDEDERIKFRVNKNSSPFTYENNYIYDSLGYLMKIIEEQFIGSTNSDLLATKTSDFIYKNGTLSKIIENNIVNNGYGEDFKTTYEIEYYKELNPNNSIIIADLIGRFSALDSPIFEGSFGKIPIQLMKSITEKTEGYKSGVTHFTYQFDKNKFVSKVIIEKTTVSGETFLNEIEYKYHCK